MRMAVLFSLKVYSFPINTGSYALYFVEVSLKRWLPKIDGPLIR